MNKKLLFYFLIVFFAYSITSCIKSSKMIRPKVNDFIKGHEQLIDNDSLLLLFTKEYSKKNIIIKANDSVYFNGYLGQSNYYKKGYYGVLICKEDKITIVVNNKERIIVLIDKVRNYLFIRKRKIGTEYRLSKFFEPYLLKH